MAQDIVLTGIISYPTLFEPKQINGKGDPKFSGTLILDPATDWNALNACIQEAIGSKFGNQVPANLRQPIVPADEDGFPGMWKIHAYSDAERAPQVVDQRVQPVMDRSQIFAGCKVNMYVRFYGYDTSGNKGLAVALNAVMIVDNINVTRLDNRRDAKDVFKPVPGAPAPLAPTAYSAPGGAPGMYPPPPQPQTPPGYGQPQQPVYAPNPAMPTAGGPAVPPGPPAAAQPAAGHPSNPAYPGAPAPGPNPAMPWLQ